MHVFVLLFFPSLASLCYQYAESILLWSKLTIHVTTMTLNTAALKISVDDFHYRLPIEHFFMIFPSMHTRCIPEITFLISELENKISYKNKINLLKSVGNTYFLYISSKLTGAFLVTHVEFTYSYTVEASVQFC